MVRLRPVVAFDNSESALTLPGVRCRPSPNGARTVSETRSSRSLLPELRVRAPIPCFTRRATRPMLTVATFASIGMFGVPKYSAALEKIRQERNVTGLFNHNLVAIDNAKKVATFATGPDGKTSEQEFDFLHVVPPQGAPDFLKGSPIGASRSRRPFPPVATWTDAAGGDELDAQRTRPGGLPSTTRRHNRPSSTTSSRSATRRRCPTRRRPPRSRRRLRSSSTTSAPCTTARSCRPSTTATLRARS